MLMRISGKDMAIQTVDDINGTPSLQGRPSFLLMAVLSSLIHALFLGILFVAADNPFPREAETRKLSVIPINLSSPVLHQVSRKDSIRQASIGRMMTETHDAPGKQQNGTIDTAESQKHAPPPPEKASGRDISETVGSEALPSPPANQTENVASAPGLLLPATSGSAGNDPATRADPSVVKPRYALTPSPAYPRAARNQGQEGVVLLSVEVLADGRTGHILVKKSSGYALLDRSALEAVRAWRFEPARRKQTPLAMTVDIPIRFSLKKDD